MPSFRANPEHVMPDVYSYPFPEVRELLGSLSLDPRFMLNTVTVEEASGLLAPFDFEPKLDLPRRNDGTLDLDELHVPVIERISDRVGANLPGLNGFEHSYPTHGSSQAMFTLMAEWNAQGSMDSLAVLEGEYEGYGAYAESLKIPVVKHQSLEDAEPKKGQVWFISNPSALDGNWIEEKTWQKFVADGNEIVYDAAYVGLTPEASIDVSAPNIRAVLTSPSKIFGVFRYRNTGVTHTRDAVNSMYGTKWFKDVPALLETLKLYETFGANDLPNQYREAQETVCQALGSLVGAEVIASDVLLLGNSAGPVNENFGQYARAGKFRFGLTKLLEDLEAFNRTKEES